MVAISFYLFNYFQNDCDPVKGIEMMAITFYLRSLFKNHYDLPNGVLKGIENDGNNLFLFVQLFSNDHDQKMDRCVERY